VVAFDGKDGLEKALTNTFDLILLDLILPEMDGFAVMAELRAKKIKTPVVVLSNLGQDEDRKKAKDLGVINYLVKSNAPLSEIVVLVKKSAA
jgi:DNA-binding response OmpR family regulator